MYVLYDITILYHCTIFLVAISLKKRKQFNAKAKSKRVIIDGRGKNEENASRQLNESFFVLFALYYKISSVACGIWIRRASSHVRDKILQQERIRNVELCYENVR